MNEQTKQQLAAISELHEILDRKDIEHWLIGGWAVDFHNGAVTRNHEDIDLAVWFKDLSRIKLLLERGRWQHAPEQDEDGGTGYERGALRLELTFLLRAKDGNVYTPLRQGREPFPKGSFEENILELGSGRCNVVGLASITKSKSSPRLDPDDAAKDRADFKVLRQIDRSK